VGRLLQRESAAELIERRSGVFGLDERRLAADLRHQPAEVVVSALDRLAGSNDDDDVAYEYMASIPAQEGEPALAREDRRILERLRSSLLAGAVSGGERSQAQRIDAALGENAAAGGGGVGEWVAGVGGDAVQGVTDAGTAAAAMLDRPTLPTASAWRGLPEPARLGVVDRLLQLAEQLIGRVSGDLGTSMMREFTLGGIKAVQTEDRYTRLAFADRLVDLMSGGDRFTGTVGFLKGVLLGLWDLVRLPYDLVMLVIDTVKAIEELGTEQVIRGAELLAESSGAAWSALEETFSEPAKAAEALKALMVGGAEAALAGARQAGRGLARLMIENRDRLTDVAAVELGRQVSPFLVDLIVGAITDGVGVIVSRTATTAARVRQLLRAGVRVFRMLFEAVEALIGPLLRAGRVVVRVFTNSRFGRWLDSFVDWLDAVGVAITAAQTLYAEGAEEGEEGEQGEEDEEEGEEAPDPDAAFDEEEYEITVEQAEAEVEPEGDSAGAQLAPKLMRQTHGGGGGGAGGGGGSGGGDLLRGDPFEDLIQRRLREGTLEGLPKMDHVLKGQFGRAGPSGRRRYGIDLIGIRFGPRGNLLLYRVEVKGGRYLSLGSSAAGMQTGANWTVYAINGALDDPAVRSRLMRHFPHLTEAQLRRRLRAGRSVIIHHATAVFHPLWGERSRRRFAHARGRGTKIVPLPKRRRRR
jgi:hypothetical protein